MPQDRNQATVEFKRLLIWVALIGVAVAVAAVFYLSRSGEMSTHMVVATVGGVFVSMVLGCGLFALAFFSDKSGHDQDASDATVRQDRDEP
jgi:ABC-type Fe3+-siderophore transport system permease subunit